MSSFISWSMRASRAHAFYEASLIVPSLEFEAKLGCQRAQDDPRNLTQSQHKHNQIWSAIAVKIVSRFGWHCGPSALLLGLHWGLCWATWRGYFDSYRLKRHGKLTQGRAKFARERRRAHHWGMAPEVRARRLQHQDFGYIYIYTYICIGIGINIFAIAQRDFKPIWKIITLVAPPQLMISKLYQGAIKCS